MRRVTEWERKEYIAFSGGEYLLLTDSELIKIVRAAFEAGEDYITILETAVTKEQMDKAVSIEEYLESKQFKDLIGVKE